MQPFHHAKVVHAADIGMRDLSRDADLIPESSQRRLAVMRRSQELQRDSLVENQVEGFVDLTHASVSEQLKNAVASGEHRASRETPFFGCARRRRRTIEHPIGSSIGL